MIERYISSACGCAAGAALACAVLGGTIRVVFIAGLLGAALGILTQINPRSP